MDNTFYVDLLRRFREDLRQGDMDSLTSHVQTAGLDVLLDPEFLSLTCQHDARPVVVLIATLGAANSQAPEPYQRLLASYQCLQNQLSLQDASAHCALVCGAPAGYYQALLSSAQQRTPLPNVGTFSVKADDLKFGVELLINAGNGTAAMALLKVWQRIDPSAMPWLLACRATTARGRYAFARQESATLAATARLLIDCAPKDQAAIAQEMRIQCAELALKARDGAVACLAAEQAFAHTPNFDRRFILAKAKVLHGQLPTAMTNMDEMLRSILNKDILIDSAQTTGAYPFDVMAAEETLLTVNHLLRAKGLKPFLMSGTLLGYARDGGLLPHDKDIDLGIIGWEDQFTVAEALLEAGHFQFDLAQLAGKSRFLISAHDMRNGMAIDFFMFHDKGDHYLHGIDFDMGFTQNFRFSKFGLKEVEFLGVPFCIPDNLDQNLTENYGDWRTPASAYVVTVESPALCATPDSRGFLVYMEILKTFLKQLKPQRIERILDYLATQNNALLDSDLTQRLRQWCAEQTLALQKAQEHKHSGSAVTTSLPPVSDADRLAHINTKEKASGTIRVGFLVHATEIFSALEPIISGMQQSDSSFELYFFAIPRNYTGHRGEYTGAEAPYYMLKSKYNNVALLEGNSKNDLILLKTLNLDYIFRQSPWDNHIPPLFSSRHLSNFKLCYTPYGFMTADIPEQQYNQAFHNYCKFIFCETAFHLEEFNKHRTLKKNGVFKTGYPRFELMANTFNSKEEPAAWPIVAGATLPKVIWAPHHSIGSHWLNYSTFLQYKDMMLACAQEKKISILFRPHPALREKLIDAKAMTNDEYDSYLLALNATESSKVDDQSDYIATFAASDYMITDGVGFFSEYLLTGKPLIHTRKTHSQPLNDIGQWMMDAFRKVDDATQLSTVLNEISVKAYRDQELSIRMEKRQQLTAESMGATDRIIEILQFNSALTQRPSYLEELSS